MPFTHVVLGTNNLDKARTFYDRALAPLGMKRQMDLETASLWGAAAPELMITKPRDGKSATASNGMTIGFSAPNNAAVDKFHSEALAAGGKCEGPPGPRANAGPNAYAAYVRDTDGNKIVALSFAGK